MKHQYRITRVELNDGYVRALFQRVDRTLAFDVQLDRDEGIAAIDAYRAQKTIDIEDAALEEMAPGRYAKEASDAVGYRAALRPLPPDETAH